MEDKRESFLTGYPNHITYECTRKIMEQMEKNICKIKIGHQGTGFFCKIPFPDKENMLPVFITNNHIINEELLNKKDQEIEFDIKGEENKIKINLNNRKKYTNKEYDVTIIEIKDNDNVNNYLELNEIIINDILNNKNQNKEFEDKTIYVIQYPKGELSVSYGVLTNIILDNIYNFHHKCCTDNGASGSPVLTLNNKVFGIHKNGAINNNFNKGTFLNFPIKEFIQKNYNNINKITKEDINLINNKDNQIINNLNYSFKKSLDSSLNNSINYSFDQILEDIVKKNKETKIFKNNLLAAINNSQLIIKKQIKNEEKIYDYLCLRLDRKILSFLKDSHYDCKTVFTENIKYIDGKESTNCIVFITMEYFYLFNIQHNCCFYSPLIELNSMSISNTSNYVSFFFKGIEGIIFETFRVLELVNFMKIIKSRQKHLKFIINLEPFIYTKTNDSKKNNFVEYLYYGKAIFSGIFKKQIEGIFTSDYKERFGVLCEIGLIILESPNGKPEEIINLLFADISGFITNNGMNGLAIKVRENIYKFIFDNEKIKNEWESKINNWKKNNSLLTKF